MAEAFGKVLGGVLDALPNPVFVKDEQHRWVLLNDSYCQFMGHRCEELLGKSDYDFFPREQADVFWSKDDLVFSTGGVNENEERFTDSLGREHVILTRKTLHVDPEGRRFLVGVITDITERKHIEEELRRSRDDLERRITERTAELNQLNRELQASSRRKDEFLGMLSHELRNPLAPIRSSVYLLRHADPTSAQADRARTVIERQSEHLTRIVDDLLDVTRIARGKILLHRDRVDLRDLVARATEDVRQGAEQRGVKLRVTLPESRLWSDADATRITQVIDNLVNNAIKFTPAGGEIAVTLRDVDATAEIDVRDTGTGIDPELLATIFEAFVQGKRTLARTEGGLGLGLALVKGLVELHGGSVAARSEGIGKGAEFIVRLPLVGPLVDEHTSHKAPRGATTPRSVLVVDDNADAAESLAEVIRLFGHHVEVAYDGPSAIEKVRQHRPDVVLCDIGLPGMNGYAVAQVLRAEHDGTLRLVAVSGYAQPADVEKATAAGFDAHVAKPFDPEKIDRLLGSARPAGA